MEIIPFFTGLLFILILILFFTLLSIYLFNFLKRQKKLKQNQSSEDQISSLFKLDGVYSINNLTTLSNTNEIKPIYKKSGLRINRQTRKEQIELEKQMKQQTENRRFIIVNKNS